MTKKGKVYIVGAGPGDAGLITVKGADLLKKADVVLYDNLVNKELLNYCTEDAEMIYVGKFPGKPSRKQDEINDLLLHFANAAQVVVRLKGGDPFVFGRGAEEALVLRNNDIDFEIVPGITAGIGAASYAGIPVTSRGYNSTVAFVTGHKNPAEDLSAIKWKCLANGIETIVFYMAIKNLPQITRKLLEHGKPSKTPVAITEWGTTEKQRTVTGCLGNIAELAKNASIKPPSIVVVGDVVGFRDKIDWFTEEPAMAFDY
ncbi:MAG: uroporphyrinogen-III C-methyltransferase [Bacteroidota bacterium]